MGLVARELRAPKNDGQPKKWTCTDDDDDETQWRFRMAIEWSKNGQICHSISLLLYNYHYYIVFFFNEIPQQETSIFFPILKFNFTWNLNFCCGFT